MLPDTSHGVTASSGFCKCQKQRFIVVQARVGLSLSGNTLDRRHVRAERCRSAFCRRSLGIVAHDCTVKYLTNGKFRSWYCANLRTCAYSANGTRRFSDIRVSETVCFSLVLVINSLLDRSQDKFYLFQNYEAICCILAEKEKDGHRMRE